jgi:hypothetical protein
MPEIAAALTALEQEGEVPLWLPLTTLHLLWPVAVAEPVLLKPVCPVNLDLMDHLQVVAAGSEVSMAAVAAVPYLERPVLKIHQVVSDNLAPMEQVEVVFTPPVAEIVVVALLSLKVKVSWPAVPVEIPI